MKTITNILKYTTLLMLCMAMLSCEKEESEKNYPEEKPLQAYFQNAGFDQKIEEYPDMHPIEHGLRFTPIVKGKITAVTVRLPQTTANVRVTIWNATSKHVLRTIVLPIVVAGEETRQNIDELNITTETSYAISVNANNWYHREREVREDVSYPVIAGNFLINGYGYRGGVGQLFPDEENIEYYYTGEVGFVFQQTP